MWLGNHLGSTTQAKAWAVLRMDNIMENGKAVRNLLGGFD
jgi:hypothetical protein